MKVTGFNHLTIKVSSLERSLSFYAGVLGMKLVHHGKTDAYLEWGTAWVCLIERPGPEAGQPAYGMDHAAFSIEENDFDEAVVALRQHGVPIVRGPIERGGGRCVNFLDPDGTQLELNTGSLAVRMRSWE